MIVQIVAGVEEGLMKFRLVSALVVAALPAAAPAALVPQLAPLAFLAGSCWRGSEDEMRSDTHCFTPVYGGHFLRDRHIVAGGKDPPYLGETLYRWSAEAQAISYAYYSSDGGFGSGVARRDGDALSFTVAMDAAGAGPPPPPSRMRTTWTRESDQAYTAHTEIGEGEGWRTLWRVRFTRVGAAPAD
jgi:hypothetical protein